MTGYRGLDSYDAPSGPRHHRCRNHDNTGLRGGVMTESGKSPALGEVSTALDSSVSKVSPWRGKLPRMSWSAEASGPSTTYPIFKSKTSFPHRPSVMTISVPPWVGTKQLLLKKLPQPPATLSGVVVVDVLVVVDRTAALVHPASSSVVAGSKVATASSATAHLDACDSALCAHLWPPSVVCQTLPPSTAQPSTALTKTTVFENWMWPK